MFPVAFSNSFSNRKSQLLHQVFYVFSPNSINFFQMFPSPFKQKPCVPFFSNFPEKSQRFPTVFPMWLWINTYKNTIFSGLFTSINPSYFDVNRRGFHGFWHTAIWISAHFPIIFPSFSLVLTPKEAAAPRTQLPAALVMSTVCYWKWP